MRTRTLGTSGPDAEGLAVSAVGLGCMGTSRSFGPDPGDRGGMPSCAARSSAG